MAKLTADTITDEQIRELRREQLETARAALVENDYDDRDMFADLDFSYVALRADHPDGRLGLFTGLRITRQIARARCAEILNARREAK